uniref:ATP-binding response regulator n=1 Tax=uncultured Pseudacidovorax sp. TaxID=679313 RepID=UPI0025EAC584
AIRFVDDGSGLRADRIRDRAEAQGLIEPGAALDDNALAELVFRPGFTTAAEVSELAGRGIGMDVVRAEVTALGGRIETRSTAGQGTEFRLVLPLTTAVTQVLMLRAGDLIFGVPASLVELVQRAGAAELAQAYADAHSGYGGETLPFYWAGALLQATDASEQPTGRANTVVVVRSAAQRVLLHVDEVLGSQEVVVKNLGPQLSRVPGLVGITVLASGAVVMIHNPVVLGTLHGGQARRRQRLPVERPAPDATSQEGRVSAQVPLVMVVDDSITVRRVTQRLLQREGWRVALAADGLQALELLQGERPALVLSDIEMPRMDGFDLVRNIRADAQLADLPVVMITSRIAAKHRAHAQSLGVDHYLGKPYGEDELLALVRRYAAPLAAAEPALEDAAG